MCIHFTYNTDLCCRTACCFHVTIYCGHIFRSLNNVRHFYPQHRADDHDDVAIIRLSTSVSIAVRKKWSHSNLKCHMEPICLATILSHSDLH
jgi:hypothetical protein